MVWVELLIRSAAIYVAVLFLPLVLASLAWPAIAHWCRRLVDTLVALILGKFVIVAVLSLAAGALAGGAGRRPVEAVEAVPAREALQAGGAGGGGFASVLGGAALLLLAAFAPWALFRLLPFIEAGAVGHLEGLSHRARQTAAAPVRGLAVVAMRSPAAGTVDGCPRWTRRRVGRLGGRIARFGPCGRFRRGSRWRRTPWNATRSRAVLCRKDRGGDRGFSGTRDTGVGGASASNRRCPSSLWRPPRRRSDRWTRGRSEPVPNRDRSLRPVRLDRPCRVRLGRKGRLQPAPAWSGRGWLAPGQPFPAWPVPGHPSRDPLPLIRGRGGPSNVT